MKELTYVGDHEHIKDVELAHETLKDFRSIVMALRASIPADEYLSGDFRTQISEHLMNNTLQPIQWLGDDLDPNEGIQG